MASSYSKNGILKGTVDFYCLVCETYLWSEADNIDHIAKSIHKTNLDSTHYVKDFEEDFIRKIKKGYFCELCNKLFPMMARVKIHVKEPSHNDSKNMTFFKRNGANVIAFGKVVLNDKTWNGLNDESCAYCNTEYEDEDVHKKLLSHILNIIQIKVEVDENKNVYRKIDDVSFHCLTCNMVLALNDLAGHFEEDQHKHLYQECCAISITEINKNELKEKEFNNVIEDQSVETDDRLAIPVNNIGEDTEQAHTAGGSDVNTENEVLKEITPKDAISLNEEGKNEKESKLAINSVLNKELEDFIENSENCVASPLNKKTENKEDNDINKKNKNPAEKKVNKNKTKINPPELNNTKNSEISNEIRKNKSSFNIEEYEKKICKTLKTKHYITLDENGKTLCILCDWIMDPNAKKIHVAGVHHQTMKKMHKRRLKRLKEIERDLDETEEEHNNNTENTLKSTSILDLVSKFQDNNVNINLISNTAVCKICSANLPYDINAIEEHILKHKDETCKEENEVMLQPCEVINKETYENNTEIEFKENNNEGNAETKQTEEKETYDNTNEIELKENNNEGNAETNQTKEKETYDNKKEIELKENNNEGNAETNRTKDKETYDNTNEIELKENNNEGNAETNQTEEKIAPDEDRKENELTNEQSLVKINKYLINNEVSLNNKIKSEISEPIVSLSIQKQSLSTYIKIFTGIKHMIYSDVIINDIICISAISFNYLLSTKGELKCLVCEEQVRDIQLHTNMLKHIKLLNEIPVVINDKTEFVREIHPDLLHCGFCNMTVASWSEMQDHFNTSFHKEIKNASGWRMLMYSTELKPENNNKILPETSELCMKNMFSGLF